MKQKYLYILFLLVGLVASSSVHAVKGYSCDFEKQEDRERWQLNPTANQTIYNQLKNKWHIGALGHHGMAGSNGLYISSDGGVTDTYSNNSCWVVAYDIVSLDKLSSGDYTLSFDYCALGNTSSKNVDGSGDGIYLMWIPVEDNVLPMSIATFASIPSTYENYIIPLDPKANIDFLNGTSFWKQGVVTIPNKKCDGKPHYLVFVWANTSMKEQPPGGKIDNIEIRDDRPCATPTNLDVVVQGTTSLLTWTGSASEYEVSAYSYEEQKWYGPQIVPTPQASFTNLPMGQTGFWVRSKCADDLYSLYVSKDMLVYYPDQMCVDYLNLDNSTCYIGQTKSSDDTRTFDKFTQVAPIDDGPAYESSRHTIHYDRNEYEPRTHWQQKTIPDGELASVRLGSWALHEGAERIEFSFDVDTIAYPVLLLKYFPILEAPNHDDYWNSRFKMDILIGNQSLGECVQADFNCNDVYDKSLKVLRPGAEKLGWHLTQREDVVLDRNHENFVWRDWTTVGVNLKNPEYQGKKLKVRLSVFDCLAHVHCGYVYFTLGCSDGRLKGMKCGEVNPIFEAPDGFVYRWALASSEQYRDAVTGAIPEQYVLGHGQKFEAGYHDDELYVVDCMFVQDSACFFSLYASTLATNPIAIINPKPVIKKSCTNGKYSVTFDGSRSWVQEIDHVTNDTAPSRIHHIDHYEWNVAGIAGGWSDKAKPTFDFPSSGGDWDVKLTVTSGTCDSTIIYKLHLDELKETRDTVTVVLCDDVRKKGYKWSEKPDTTYFDYGLDFKKYYNEATSCDSFLYLNLIEPVRIPVYKLELPDNLPFYYRGRRYTEADVDPYTKSLVDTIPNDMCDTTWILNLTIYESLKASMPDSFMICGDETQLTLPYAITRGRSLGYAYSFADPTLPADTVDQIEWVGNHQIVIPFNPMPKPNMYDGALKLIDSVDYWSVTLPFKLAIRYRASIVEQKWNDVLYVLAPDYNGHYEFTAFQWYRNDTLLEGETGSYLYQPLDMKAYYHVELTRTDDDGLTFVTMPSCPITPVDRTNKQKQDKPIVISVPSFVVSSQKMPVHVDLPATLWIYTLNGQLYATYSLPEGNSILTAPAMPGLYIIRAADSEGNIGAQRLLVQ